MVALEVQRYVAKGRRVSVNVEGPDGAVCQVLAALLCSLELAEKVLREVRWRWSGGQHVGRRFSRALAVVQWWTGLESRCTTRSSADGQSHLTGTHLELTVRRYG